jgi:hypothetical protein
VFVVVPLRLRKRSEGSLKRWYLERSALNRRLLISIFFLYDLGAGTISDVPKKRWISTENQGTSEMKLTRVVP